MSFRKYSINQLRWYEGGYGLIARRIQKEIRDAYTDQGILRSHWKGEVRNYHFLLFRLGLNLYKSGQYEGSIQVLRSLCGIVDNDPRKAKDYGILDVSFLHHVIGKSEVQLFLQSYDHVHLERGYKDYQSAVNHIHANLVAMFMLPTLLIDFGKLLEYFGSFEAALEIYGQVLTKFPNFHGYFDALYRTAVVAKHLATITSNEDERKEAVDKCIDIFQFLLEALPSNIQAVHVILLYARTLEASGDPSTRFRANNVYRSLHTVCKGIPLAGGDSVADSKVWAALPETWYLLGLHARERAEFLIAKEAFSRYIELLKKQIKPGKDLSHYLTVDRCVILAYASAAMQDFPEAIKYAEVGLKIDHYNTEIRELLSKWNTGYQDNLSEEIKAINRIKHIWKDRVWTQGFVSRLRKKIVKESEEKLAINHFDVEAREHLAYYARDQYRPIFLHEDLCIVKIQKWFRRIKREMVWMEAQRHFHTARATEAVTRLLQRYYNHGVRQEILALAKNKFIHRKHAIHLHVSSILLESKAFNVLFRALRLFSFRRHVHQRIALKERDRMLKYMNKIILAQNCLRRYVAKARYRRLQKVHQLREAAARKIQLFYRKRKSSFRFVVYMAMYSEYHKKAKAMTILRRKLPALLNRLREKRRRGFQVLEERNNRRRNRLRRVDDSAAKVSAAIRIQHFCSAVMFRYKLKTGIRELKKRRHINFNFYYRPRLEALFAAKQLYRYQNPGISTSSESFLQMLGKEVVICDKSMHAVDYMLLGLVLKHPQSNIRCLILQNVDVFKEDVSPLAFKVRVEDVGSPISPSGTPLASSPRSSNGSPRDSPREHDNVRHLPHSNRTSPSSVLHTPRDRELQEDLSMVSAEDQSKLSFFISLTKSLSLKSIIIIEGNYHRHVLERVFQLVQLDNARIVELVVQDINHFCHDAPAAMPSSHAVGVVHKRQTVVGARAGRSAHVHTSLLQEVLTPRRAKNRPLSSSSTAVSSPRIVTQTAPPPTNAATLCLSANLLLLDYFNYSIPGIQTICLHDCKLSDANITMFANALAVNTSLQSLYLSLNLLTDAGFVALFKAMLSNKNCRLALLDLSYNLVQMVAPEVVALLSGYRVGVHPQLQHKNRIMTVDLSHNPILEKYDVLAYSAMQRIVPQLEVIYEHAESHRRRLSMTAQTLATLKEVQKQEKHQEAQRKREAHRRRSQEVDPVILRKIQGILSQSQSLPAIPVPQARARTQTPTKIPFAEREAVVLPPLQLAIPSRGGKPRPGRAGRAPAPVR